MTEFFTYLNANRGGILVLLLCLIFIILLVNWVAWIFSWGRFRTPTRPSREPLRYLIGQALVKIIDDFRHLLALVIVVIFALALWYAMIRAGSNQQEMKDAIQTVVASLGGLVGSIIGYYFGESAIGRLREVSPAEEKMPKPEEEPITPVPPPPKGAPDSEKPAGEGPASPTG